MITRLYRPVRRCISYVPTCPDPKYDTGCTFCEIPKFPADKSINFDMNLNNTKALPWKHVLYLSHGFDDISELPAKIEMVPGSFNDKITGFRRHFSPYHPILVSNVVLSNNKTFIQKEGANYDHLVMIYPDRKIVKFNDEQFEDFVKYYLRPKDHVVEEVYNPFKSYQQRKQITIDKPIDKPIDSSIFEESPVIRDMILTCGHTKRDIRCGLLAPLIKNELELVCKKENLEMDIGMISHVGGHAYAGNLIYFPKDASREIIWYGRVFPDKVQGIVTETVLNDRVVKDLYRGEV